MGRARNTAPIPSFGWGKGLYRDTVHEKASHRKLHQRLIITYSPNTLPTGKPSATGRWQIEECFRIMKKDFPQNLYTCVRKTRSGLISLSASLGHFKKEQVKELRVLTQKSVGTDDSSLTIQIIRSFA